jgi:phosphoribosylanthranilate isomerase
MNTPSTPSTINSSIVDALGKLGENKGPREVQPNEATELKLKATATKVHVKETDFYPRWAPVVCDYPYPMGVPFEM